DGMQSTRGSIRTGGDAAGAALAGTPPTQPPLALYSGIVTVKSDGWAEVLFDIPAFAGTVRVMAVAWSKDKVGKASGDVTVRDPVVLTATLPRFLLTADRAQREHQYRGRAVRRPRAGDRRRTAFRRSLDRARRRGAPESARPLSVRLFRADDEPRAAAALCQ